MKIGKKFVLLLLLAVAACILYIWVSYSPKTELFRWQGYVPETESDLASAFAYALSINQPVTYNWIDPNLKPRLDEWMNTHQSTRCKHRPDAFWVGIGTNRGSEAYLTCLGYNGPRYFSVDDIVIKDMRVTDWGEVIDEDI